MLKFVEFGEWLLIFVYSEMKEMRIFRWRVYILEILFRDVS